MEEVIAVVLHLPVVQAEVLLLVQDLLHVLLPVPIHRVAVVEVVRLVPAEAHVVPVVEDKQNGDD